MTSSNFRALCKTIKQFCMKVDLVVTFNQFSLAAFTKNNILSVNSYKKEKANRVCFVSFNASSKFLEK